MKITIIECVMGIFSFEEAGQLVDAVLFPKDPKETAIKLARIEAGEVVDEVASLVERLRDKGYAVFIFENAETAWNARDRLNIRVEVAKPSEAGELLRANLDDFAVRVGFATEASDLRRWTHRVSMELTKMRVRRAVEKRDLAIVQAIHTIDDLDATLNLFMSRVREWFGLYFPEFDRLVEKHETYARLVATLSDRESFTQENLEKAGLPKLKAKRISQAARTSMGAQVNMEDMLQIQAVCKAVLELYSIRQSMERYLDSALREVAPNIQALAGSLLGARLIALAGGLDNMAKLPASTIQVLGAEKALFRSLRTGSRPPKHGIIFQHSLIHGAKLWQRGKVARALAGSLAIAARSDAFSGKYISDRLKASVERRVKEVQEKYKKPSRSHSSPKKPTRRRKRGHRR